MTYCANDLTTYRSFQMLFYMYIYTCNFAYLHDYITNPRTKFDQNK